MIVESGNPGPAEAEALRNEVRRLRCGPEDLMDPGTPNRELLAAIDRALSDTGQHLSDDASCGAVLDALLAHPALLLAAIGAEPHEECPNCGHTGFDGWFALPVDRRI